MQHIDSPPLADMRRLVKRLRRRIADLQLDLSGLNIYTEAASGPYLSTPVLAAMAGARHVFAQTRNSRYGSATDVMQATIALAEQCDVADSVSVFDTRRMDLLAQSDIVTNSGFVRPMDAELIDVLKPTAVIPLMWETWEFRPEDFDLKRCKEKGILVLGTGERGEPCNIMPYCSFLAIKLLLELGLEGPSTNVLVLGNAPFPGEVIARDLRRLSVNVTWFSADEGSDHAYEHLHAYFEEHGESFDAILLAEHRHGAKLLGAGGYLPFETISAVNPDVLIGIIAGNVDVEEIQSSGLTYYPKTIAPFGYMTYQPAELGPGAVLLLYSAGLKVGEAMARARLRGLGLQDSATFALNYSPAMDFPGELAWL